MTIHRPISLIGAAPSACAHRPDARCENCKVRAFSICAALKPDELAELEEIAHPVSFAAKDSVFAEGDAVSNVYNVTAGTIRLYQLFRDGRRQVIGFSFPGDFLGVQLEAEHGFCADAIGEVSACRFSRADFSALLARKPHLMKALHERTARDMRLMQDQVVALGRRSAEERVGWFLTQLRQRAARCGNGDGERVDIPMSRQDIADYLGLTIETVSRTFSGLARDKAVRIEQGGVRVLNEASLGNLAAV
jgi:CRP/FNR family transcriptional regulator